MSDCQPSYTRPKADLMHVLIDKAVLDAACRYADAHGLDIDQFVQSALVAAMVEKLDVVPVLFCATHRCAMEVNTSGTATACPANEGAEEENIFLPERVFPEQFT